MPWKVWYLAPNFRAERPQAGRYRQHWQLGVEVIGVDDPDVDVEVIALLARLLPRSRTARRDVVRQLDGRHREPRARTARCCSTTGARTPTLIGDEMERAEANPLRILDSKRPDWQDMLERAPQLGEYLTDASAEHFARVQEGLAGSRHPVRDRTAARARLRLLHEHRVRVPERQRSMPPRTRLGGGGRYDRLAEEMGGPAGAVDRIRHRASSASCSRAMPRACFPAPEARVDVFVVDLMGGTAEAARRPRRAARDAASPPIGRTAGAR